MTFFQPAVIFLFISDHLTSSLPSSSVSKSDSLHSNALNIGKSSTTSSNSQKPDPKLYIYAVREHAKASEKADTYLNLFSLFMLSFSQCCVNNRPVTFSPCKKILAVRKT